MTKTKQELESILDGIGDGAEACIDLADVFMEVGGFVSGVSDTIGDESMRMFRRVADIVDPPPGQEDSDERRRVLPAIREARMALDAFERGRAEAGDTETGGMSTSERCTLPS